MIKTLMRTAANGSNLKEKVVHNPNPRPSFFPPPAPGRPLGRSSAGRQTKPPGESVSRGTLCTNESLPRGPRHPGLRPHASRPHLPTPCKPGAAQDKASSVQRVAAAQPPLLPGSPARAAGRVPASSTPAGPAPSWEVVPSARGGKRSLRRGGKLRV